MDYFHSKYGTGKSRKKKSKWKFVILFILILILITAAAAYFIYGVLFKPNVWTPENKPEAIFIPTGSTFEDVKIALYQKGLIINRNNFEWVAEKKGYTKKIFPGKYLIEDGINNNDLVNLLRSGIQTPVKVIFNNVRDIYQLAGKVGGQIEADSASIAGKLTDRIFLDTMGLNLETISTIFIPNTYEFYWNTTASQFIDKMFNEHQKFWLGKRSTRATEIGMTPMEVVILASIVEKETNLNTERPIIAGLYMNRLNNGWFLQADPTLVYAYGDFQIKRVLNIHKEVDSPYNTYKYPGLPPGPICIPSIASIDAVLHYNTNDYYFMCANDNLSGSHVFSRTLNQHNQNARKYQAALNKLKIYD
jgi:UPF0755 protein